MFFSSKIIKLKLNQLCHLFFITIILTSRHSVTLEKHKKGNKKKFFLVGRKRQRIMRLETFLIFPYTFLLFVTLYKYALSVNISLRTFGGEKENIEVIKQKKVFSGIFSVTSKVLKWKLRSGREMSKKEIWTISIMNHNLISWSWWLLNFFHFTFYCWGKIFCPFFLHFRVYSTWVFVVEFWYQFTLLHVSNHHITTKMIVKFSTLNCKRWPSKCPFSNLNTAWCQI